METPLQTAYLGYQISIEPYEWGYLAHIVEPGSAKRFVAFNSSAMRALEEAFDLIDKLFSPADRPTTRRQPPPRLVVLSRRGNRKIVTLISR